MKKRIELWSCGGGRQSAGIAALISQGRLPKPDHVAMVALEWEVRSVWPYVNKYIRATMEGMGIPFSIVSRKKYATVEFWSGQDGRSTVLPVYSNKSGSMSKLPEYCSGEWKREVVLRWTNDMHPEWKKIGVNNWIGISWDENGRRRSPRKKWFQPAYPLLDVCQMYVSGCMEAVDKMGWPQPPRSRCRHCPNQSDHEWAELAEEEFLLACDLEDEIRLTDPHAFFHKSLIPLRMVELKPEPEGMFTGGCSSGTCY